MADIASVVSLAHVRLCATCAAGRLCETAALFAIYDDAIRSALEAMGEDSAAVAGLLESPHAPSRQRGAERVRAAVARCTARRAA